MHAHKHPDMKLIRLSDAFLPTALLVATLLGRDAIAFALFAAQYLVKCCALATSNGLRAAFASQPSLRYAQGSTLLALAAQPAGAAIALPLMWTLCRAPIANLLILCGLLLNIEHVFYEYLFALGDKTSAARCRGITAVLTLTGLLLSARPWSGAADASAFNPGFLCVTSCLCALVAVAVGLAMGGRPKPKMNAEVLRRAPLSLLQVALYPALALGLLRFTRLGVQTFAPLYAGLILYELCRTPFRRTTMESRSMNRILLIVCAAAIIIALPFVLGRISPQRRLLQDIPCACGALILAAACAASMYGRVDLGKKA